MELSYRHWGEPSDRNNNRKPKILLLHGMGGTGSLWRPIAALLEDEFEILAPDQRGHGRSQSLPESDPAPGFSPLDYAEDLVQTLAQTGFHPCIAVGHSMGARTACALAELRPEWIRGLVIVDLGLDGLAGGGLGESLAKFIQILPDQFKNRDEAREFMRSHCPDPSIAQYLMAVATLTPPAEGGALRFPFSHQALLKTIDAARGTSLRPWILNAATRGIPVLALRGETSRVWSKESFEKDRLGFEPSLPVFFEEISGAGHGLPFEKRNEFVQRLKQFSA
jgi:2-(acetamidomethylene)succinate hydrolase